MTVTSVFNHFIGRVLKKDITDNNGVLLVPKDTKMTKELIDNLFVRNIILYEYNFLSQQEEEYTSRNIDNELTIINSLIITTQKIFKTIEKTDEIPIMQIRQEIIPHIDSLTNKTDLFKILRAIQTKDRFDYNHKHAVGVAIMANLIGRWLSVTKSELSLLTMAGYLHDVGKLKVEKGILEKPDKLTDEEFEIVKKHTIYGYEMLKKTTGLNKRAALVALQHHEKIDGTGYPLQLKGEQIDSFSKIVSVCDSFHAMLSSKVYRPACYFYKMMDEMQGGVFGKFEPEILFLLFKKISHALENGIIVLSDNSIGRIALMNPYNPLKPLIKIGNEIIDLTIREDLKIIDIL